MKNLFVRSVVATCLLFSSAALAADYDQTAVTIQSHGSLQTILLHKGEVVPVDMYTKTETSVPVPGQDGDVAMHAIPTYHGYWGTVQDMGSKISYRFVSFGDGNQVVLQGVTNVTNRSEKIDLRPVTGNAVMG